MKNKKSEISKSGQHKLIFVLGFPEKSNGKLKLFWFKFTETSMVTINWSLLTAQPEGKKQLSLMSSVVFLYAIIQTFLKHHHK